MYAIKLMIVKKFEQILHKQLTDLEDLDTLALAIEKKLCQVKVHKVDLSKFLNERIKSSNFTIAVLPKVDLQISYPKLLTKPDWRNNILQIMYKDVSILWDLDKGKEVNFK